MLHIVVKTMIEHFHRVLSQPGHVVRAHRPHGEWRQQRPYPDKAYQQHARPRPDTGKARGHPAHRRQLLGEEPPKVIKGRAGRAVG